MRLPVEPNPVLVEHARQCGRARQNRIRIASRASPASALRDVAIIGSAARIRRSAGKYPYGLLTMIVSLEAIFLSTFVMISQNRADAKRQVVADQQWQVVQVEDTQNEELLELSRQILQLTKQVHAYAAARSSGTPPAGDSSP